MASKKTLKTRLRSGEKVIGSWLRLANFSSTELMVEFGYDFLIVDMQHGEATEAQLLTLLGAFRGSGVTPVVRVPHHDYRTINRVLDLGFQAILAPLVNTVEQAEQIVKAAKYPPIGARSYGPMRPPAQRRPAPDYIQEANDSTAVFIIVEHILALRDFEKITAVPGIDGIFVGAFDLTFSLRESPQMQAIGDLVIREAEKAGRVPKTGSEMSRFVPYPGELFSLEILRKAKKQRVPFGIIAHSAREALAWFNRGAQWPTLHSDFAFLKGAAEAGLKGVREGLMKK